MNTLKLDCATLCLPRYYLRLWEVKSWEWTLQLEETTLLSLSLSHSQSASWLVKQCESRSNAHLLFLQRLLHLSDKKVHNSLPLREEVLCVSVSLAAAEGLLWWEAPCPAASLLEKLHLLQEGRRTHDLKEIEGSSPIQLYSVLKMCLWYQICSHYCSFIFCQIIIISRLFVCGYSPQTRQKDMQVFALISAIIVIKQLGGSCSTICCY